MAALSLRTRDGYVTSGRCALASTPSLSASDAARLARASLRLLDDALIYLELSVETLDLGLLGRMFADYLCSREATLVEFTAFGALMVRIASPEHSASAAEDADGSIRAKRQALLQSKRGSSTDETLVAACATICAFLSYLARRVVVRGVELLQAHVTSWLECDDDATLQRQLRATSGLVCVMPVEKRSSRGECAPSGVPFERTKLPEMPPVPAQLLSTPRRALQPLPSSRSMSLEPVAKRQRQHYRLEESEMDPSQVENTNNGVSGLADEVGELEGPRNDITEHASESQRRGRAFSAETSALRQRLAEHFTRYEAQRPWKTVFHAALPLPFVEDDAPELARRLRSFWKNHGRAAWERNFWSPLDKVDYQLRRNRQAQARTAFEAIIREAFDTFGAAFFVRLETSEIQDGGTRDASSISRR
ncbi:hypothetical protein PINS_up000559 [Pythium insidiosum]|nr:hypothetical protein PINS_up000559 [Pythium insidiosum]